MLHITGLNNYDQWKAIVDQLRTVTVFYRESPANGGFNFWAISENIAVVAGQVGTKPTTFDSDFRHAIALPDSGETVSA